MYRRYESMTLLELEAENQRLMAQRAAIKAQMMELKIWYDLALANEESRRQMEAQQKSKIDPAMWQGVGTETNNG